MKLFLLGATGNSGRRILSLALQRGHDVTVWAREPSRLPGPENQSSAMPRVVTGDIRNLDLLRRAMSGHDTVINAAGSTASPDGFTSLVGNVIKATEHALGPGGRIWLFGGAAALDLPGTSTMTLDLPLIPKIYQLHRTNLEAIRQTDLDWSMLCPGPMIGSPDGRATAGLRTSADIWPVDGPLFTGVLPRIASALAFVRRVPEMTVYYEDAACVILDHLDAKGPFSRKRVGVALPRGTRRHKV